MQPTIKRRYIGEFNKDLFTSYTSKIIRVDENNLRGYAAHTKISTVSRPYLVGEKGAEICIADAGYNWLQYQPDNENWTLCAMYDNHGHIVEWYFDIVRENAVDEHGRPYSDDLFLDVVLTPDGRVLILDENELQDAYEHGAVTAGEFRMAHRVKDELIKIANIGCMEALCSRLLTLFEGETK